MRQSSTDTVDKAVCTEESGAARLEAVLVALVERKARALHAEHARARRARTHPLLLLLRSHVPDEEASIVGSSDGALPAHWCEHEVARHQRRLKLKSHHGGDLNSPEELELERRRRRRRRRRNEAAAAANRMKHRTLLVSAIDEQAKVIHVLDPDELPRRARYTIMVTACLLLFLCLLLVGVTLRMAPLIDDMVGILLDSPINPSINDAEENVAECTETSPVETNAVAKSNTTPQETCENDANQEGEKSECTSLDPELLDILGVDPSVTNSYGKEIHADLASRLEHVATAGLTKEIRKELNERYLIPSNCVKIGAPSMNLEIKAPVTEVVTKRDKGIEMRQKQLAAAISGLSTILSTELESKTRDNARLKQLMDVCRILCDIQHSESVTRRNFAIYSIKKELKEHLTSSKIDKYLFGENLAETLKAAKAVNKSGSELKTKLPAKPKPSTSTNNNLNWKSQAPARRPQGPQRGREPAPRATTTAQARFSRSAPPTSSSKTSQPPPKSSRRR